MSQDAKSDLAPTGVLRAGINLSNFLLVTGKSAAGDPEGVAPDMAREIAGRLGVPVKYVPYKTPGELADKADTGAWDIGLIGAEPQRAEKITFTAAYVEIEATYLVPAGSGLKAIADWCQENRHVPVNEQQKTLNAKLRGHYQYYGRPTNYRSIRQFYREVCRIWRKWLSRRTRGNGMTWEKFAAILRKHPLLLPRILHPWSGAGSRA